MGLPYGYVDDGINSYQRQQEKKRPPGRRIGENRAAHRKRLADERKTERNRSKKQGQATDQRCSINEPHMVFRWVGW